MPQFLYYYLFISILLLLFMGYDKGKALQNGRRVPERTLLGLGILGGALGGLLAIFLFRHKTRKLRFTIVYLLSILLHIYILWKFAF